MSGKTIAVIRNAGGTWVDEEVHVDTSGPGPIVSSRKPDDLKAFSQEMVDTFAALAPAHARSASGPG